MPEIEQFAIDSGAKNDKIDIYGELDVSVKMSKTKNENKFHALIEGKNIDSSVVNAIRRTILLSIPIYGFHRSNIHISTEKSRNMYNNDFIYNQIETLPIYEVPNYFDLENPEVFLSNEVMKKLFGKFVQEKTIIQESTETKEEERKKMDAEKKLFKIELVLDVKNTTGSDKFVSTHDAVLKIDGKISKSYHNKEPISILVLKSGEEISLRAEANLGIAQMYASYEATTNAMHKELSPMKYELYYETLGQLDKNMVFTKACIILIRKLEHLNKYIKEKYKKEPEVEESMEIQLYGENHTLGNLIATALQKCKYVSSAGYAMPHPFIDMIVISYKLGGKEKAGPIKIFTDVLDYLVRLFQMISHTAFKKTS